MKDEVLFTRAASIGSRIERELQSTTSTIDAALYRLNSPRLAQALEDAALRGTRVRLLLDHDKYLRTPATRALLANRHIPFRLANGRKQRGSKMHHKFAIIDALTVLTGSYNWTIESEEYNYEALLIVREPPIVRCFAAEFDELWAASQIAESRF
jgi:phosphatidylserine/phosphatidylglycerophosphate/cardiolipin synthase-like enzyme